ncbi:GDP/UDP-N,N'-diacetylbacillosamine 2-epimerase (hydrolyzing) [Chitinophaga sp. W3I9]|uniref:UDP-N-acetylglucosamine 2-epimerase n=1 Tax=unclassified Chitinophaga TaxID=2619133 RepID=UPI003D1F6D32
MIQKRKILFVTGARSEYDIMQPVLEQLNNCNDIELKLIVTGAHLSETFGKTVKNIENDGYEIADRIYNLVSSEDKVGRVVGIGTQITGLAHAFAREQPDIIVVVGDREEAITVSMTAAYLSIPVAHLAGGDIANDGNIDNAVRYATSKFAHIHFTFLEQHAQVLRLLGEDDFRIFNTGNPALDKFVHCPVIPKNEIAPLKVLKTGDEPYLVLIQHPIITEATDAGKQIVETLEAVVDLGIKCFINYPNSDAGNFAIIEMIGKYAGEYPEIFYLFKNLDRVNYINLLRNAAVLIGNSSSGILEAPSIGLPVVNIGSRQRERFSAGNVIYVDYNRVEIATAIRESIYNPVYRAAVKGIVNPYGDGNSAKKISDVLRSISINDKLIYKNITYKV